MPAPTPHPAASVILLREPQYGAIEVCMLRRRRGASFMASAFVFPGGGADPGESLAACAARELFEEAGVALLSPSTANAEQLADLRKRIAAGEPSPAVLDSAGLCWDESLLSPWSHWVTPSIEPRRFSAHFFVAALPEGQVPRFDDVETVEQVWISPADATGRAAELSLPPPQLRTLWELRELTSIEQVRKAARARAADPWPILPRVSMMPTPADAGASPRSPMCLLLPWDPDYLEHGQGESMPMDHRPSWAHGPSRFVMEDRAWRHLDAPGSTSAG